MQPRMVWNLQSSCLRFPSARTARSVLLCSAIGKMLCKQVIALKAIANSEQMGCPGHGRALRDHPR